MTTYSVELAVILSLETSNLIRFETVNDKTIIVTDNQTHWQYIY